MRKSMLLWGAVIAMAIGPVVVRAGAYDSVVKVVNQSMWDIDELYLSSTAQEDWGPDQLGDEVVASGDSFQLRGIPCDDYDVKLVDEDGDSCVVGGVTLCADSDAWVISDEDLLACQVVTEE